MRSIEGQKEGAMTMEDGLAEMHAQRPVQGLATKSGGQPWGGSRNTKNEDLTPKAVCRYPKGEEGEPCKP